MAISRQQVDHRMQAPMVINHRATDRTAPKDQMPMETRQSTKQKRTCVSIACIACRKRKTKCDGAAPSCAACADIYGTKCIYDPHSDHRRKGACRKRREDMKACLLTLQIIFEAILNASDQEVPTVINKIRTCDSLDAIAMSILQGDESAGKE